MLTNARADTITRTDGGGLAASPAAMRFTQYYEDVQSAGRAAHRWRRLVRVTTVDVEPPLGVRATSSCMSKLPRFCSYRQSKQKSLAEALAANDALMTFTCCACSR